MTPADSRPAVRAAYGQVEHGSEAVSGTKQRECCGQWVGVKEGRTAPAAPQMGPSLCARQTSPKMVFSSPSLMGVPGPLKPCGVPSPVTLWTGEQHRGRQLGLCSRTTWIPRPVPSQTGPVSPRASLRLTFFVSWA